MLRPLRRDEIAETIALRKTEIFFSFSVLKLRLSQFFYCEYLGNKSTLRKFDVLKGFEFSADCWTQLMNSTLQRLGSFIAHMIQDIWSFFNLWSAKQKILVFFAYFWYYDVYLKHKSNHKSNCTCTWFHIELLFQSKNISVLCQ